MLAAIRPSSGQAPDVSLSEKRLTAWLGSTGYCGRTTAHVLHTRVLKKLGFSPATSN